MVMSLYDYNDITVEEMKNELKISASITEDDDLIESEIKAACNSAEQFLNTDFKSTEIIPASVREWIKKRVCRLYENRTPGVQSEKLGSQSVAYDEGEDEYKGLWPYRSNPGM